MNMIKLASAAGIYGIMVTFLLAQAYRFSELELEILEESCPRVLEFLVKVKVIKQHEIPCK